MTADVHDTRALRPALDAIVRGTPWLMEVLRAVRDHGPTGAFVGAGAVRNTVWNALHGVDAVPPEGDVDVVYFGSSQSAEAHREALASRLPQHRWELTDQSTVHRWQSASLGRAVDPYPSVEAALRVWPETATAVAVALDASDVLHVIAPWGLGDLFALVLRPSPAILDARVFEQRVRDKGWCTRWPRLTVQAAWERGASVAVPEYREMVAVARRYLRGEVHFTALAGPTERAVFWGRVVGVHPAMHALAETWQRAVDAVWNEHGQHPVAMREDELRRRIADDLALTLNDEPATREPST